MNARTVVTALIRIAARRDRVLVALWWSAVTVTAGFSAYATARLYPGLEERVAVARAMSNSPAVAALYGPIVDAGSLGELAVLKTATMGALTVSALCAFVVVRHTRGDDAAGRTDLTATSPVGNGAVVAAAILWGVVVATIIALGSATALIVAGMPFEGSAVLGVGWIATGTLFSAVGAVAAQLAGTVRGALGLSWGVVAAAYLVRALADGTGIGWLAWFSPLGWCARMHPYAGDLWWPLVPIFAIAGLTAAAAMWPTSRRDVGAAVWTDRAGPGEGRMATIFDEVRAGVGPSFVLWSAGVLALASLFALVAGSVEDMFTGESARRMADALGGRGSLNEVFYSAAIAFVAVLAASFGIHVMTHARVDEQQGRADLMLAVAPQRARWLAPHLVFATAGSAVLSMSAGVLFGVAHAATNGDWAFGRRIVMASVAEVPAIWLVTAVAALCLGWGPKLLSTVWAAFATVVVVGEFGPSMDVPEAVVKLSPFVHTGLGSGGVPIVVVTGMLIAACACVAASFAGIERRGIGAR